MSADHLVQLFDAPRSLADGVARFLAEGWLAGDHLLVVARPRHWSLIATYLPRYGCSVGAGHFGGRLEFMDAEAVLRRVRRRGAVSIDAARAECLTALGRADGHPLRVYGEVVELLAEEGDFGTACALEDLWNTLGQSHTFKLLCGYLAPHFADPRTAVNLHAICGKHTRVESHSADSLGTWLTAGYTRRD